MFEYSVGLPTAWVHGKFHLIVQFVQRGTISWPLCSSHWYLNPIFSPAFHHSLYSCRRVEKGSTSAQNLNSKNSSQRISTPGLRGSNGVGSIVRTTSGMRGFRFGNGGQNSVGKLPETSGYESATGQGSQQKWEEVAKFLGMESSTRSGGGRASTAGSQTSSTMSNCNNKCWSSDPDLNSGTLFSNCYAVPNRYNMCDTFCLPCNCESETFAFHSKQGIPGNKLTHMILQVSRFWFRR